MQGAYNGDDTYLVICRNRDIAIIYDVCIVISQNGAL